MTARNWGALEDLAHAPHWVYVIHSAASGRCIYVGMTCNLQRRLGEHASQRGWRAPHFTVTSVEVSGRAAAEREEIARMRRYLPVQNRYPVSIAGRSSS